MSVEELVAARDVVLHHPLLELPFTRAELCVFMENHVFAVWDCSLLWKRVERELAEVESAWAPELESSCEWLMNGAR